MFRRKKPEGPAVPQPAPSEIESDAGEAGASLPKSFHSQGPVMNNKPPTPPLRTDIPRRVMDLPAASGARKPAESEGKKLIVGRDISLSGAITACDKLVVEGTVEANLTDAGSIDIAESGLFKGSAEVDEAEIGGRFEGALTVRKKLTIRATGRVAGKVRYARLVVEAGGEIAGTVEVLGVPAAPPQAQPAPAPSYGAGGFGLPADQP